jgi:hypothetical protein
MKTTQTTNRRNFLLAAGLGSAGVAAAVVAGKGAKKVAGAAPQAQQETLYQASEHVQKYYKTTKV